MDYKNCCRFLYLLKTAVFLSGITEKRGRTIRFLNKNAFISDVASETSRKSGPA